MTVDEALSNYRDALRAERSALAESRRHSDIATEACRASGEATDLLIGAQKATRDAMNAMHDAITAEGVDSESAP